MSKDKKHNGTPATNNGEMKGAGDGIKNIGSHGWMILRGNVTDKRTSLFKALKATERSLAASLGGDPSTQQMILIKDLACSLAYLESLDGYLQSLKSVVRRGRVHAVLIERIRQSAHVRENLRALGMKRVAKQIPTLDGYVESKYGSGSEKKP